MAGSPDYKLFVAQDKRDGGTHWHQVGVAWKTRNNSLMMEFNSLPLPNKQGKVIVNAFVNDGEKPPQAKPFDDFDKDEVPF